MASSVLFVLPLLLVQIAANPDAKRLYDDLMSSYNSLIRPVSNNSDRVTVRIGLKLSQLIDVNLKDQIMATNMFVEQEWVDDSLRWDPDEYGGVKILYVPSEQIWLPDLVLYNNADGNYEITIMTKAVVHHNGTVVWKPPAIYKSACNIDIQYFPFDRQVCTMKFGSWTYDMNRVDLRHKNEIVDSNDVEMGIDMSEMYLSVEWDIMAVPATRHITKYACCAELYPDVTFSITLRRKTLFYTVNLIIPVVGISTLSFLVFYLPSDCGEKVNLSINILLSLAFFLLVLLEMIPSTSLAMPLIGVYITFSLFMISLSVVVATAVVNVHYRSPSTHRMAPWVRRFFIQTLPKFLLMRPPQYRLDPESAKATTAQSENRKEMHPQESETECHEVLIPDMDCSPEIPLPVESVATYPPVLEKALRNGMFIAQHIDNLEEFRMIGEEWKYVAMVLDRLFLWIFAWTTVVGTAAVFMQAPSLYDTDEPIDALYSTVGRTSRTSPSSPPITDLVPCSHFPDCNFRGK